MNNTQELTSDLRQRSASPSTATLHQDRWLMLALHDHRPIGGRGAEDRIRSADPAIFRNGSGKSGF
jgi:hypothetical protein